MLALNAPQDWSAAGHEIARAWHETLALVGPWIFALAIVALIVRAFVQRRRYRAVGVLSDGDVERVRAAVRTAESHTTGEIVPVVLERSDSHPDARWFGAVLVSLAGTLLLIEHLPWNEPAVVIALQLAFGALGHLLAFALPGFARVFVSDARATEMAEEQALQEFQRLELHRTEGATGVLIFVSLFERRVVVLGDRGIHAKVGDEHWRGVSEVVLEHIARGELASGLCAGIERCGAVLAEHFPHQDGGRNELPDRVVVRRE